jgi:hypothetical protein
MYIWRTVDRGAEVTNHVGSDICSGQGSPAYICVVSSEHMLGIC